MGKKLRDLMIFVKAPRPGFVKRRLATQVGQEISAHLYRAFVLDLLSNLKAYTDILSVWYYPQESINEIRQWLGEALVFVAQRGRDLGERMKYAFESSFLQGTRAAVLIGSDIPDLPEDHIRKAFQELERVDAVIGPSSDGGYYLIGFTAKAFVGEVVEGLRWGSDTVCEKTLEKLETNLLTYSLLPVWRDVDELSDLSSLLARNASNESSILRTTAAVREIARTDSRFRSTIDIDGTV